MSLRFTIARFMIATVFALGASSAAFADCHCENQTAYSVSQDRGVTVMRGNIPKMTNPQRAIIAERDAAQARASQAERRALAAERDAAEARQALAARPVYSRPNYAYDRRQASPYFSGNYGFGASISKPAFKGRGRGFGGRRSISRPVFTTRIRS